MILLIDNYDSFSFNLYQMVGMLCPDIRVIRNDEMTVEEIRALQPSRIILSPGPGRPEHAGVIMDVVKELGAEVPILGVCLGHQAICMAFGATVTYAKRLMHGKQSEAVFDRESPIFSGCPERGLVARYHSLAADPDTMPSCLRVTARTEAGEIMGVQHVEYPIFGVQFHPESIMTPDGKKMLEAYLFDTYFQRIRPL
ncbi:MAG: aminodeoxychorismate/anthranilate synthase component II [Clostridia bacterium]|nr:aminodeoxychorismate/anthranilate synthase component II [Clostridia bacterium]